MENSNDSITPFLLSWSDSDRTRFQLGVSSSSSDNLPADNNGRVGDDDGTESLSRSHRLAEKRRRDRINSNLAALRKLVPNSDKMEKAALLATVIEQVKDLKQQASKSPIFSDLPAEADQVTVNSNNFPNSESDSVISNGSRDRISFRVTFCCEDRPEVLSEIIQVIKRLHLEAIEADIVCVGGRMRNKFLLVPTNYLSEEIGNATAIALKQSLGAVLSRIASSSSTTSVCSIRSKRQRWFLSSHYTQ